jgi:fatty acid desaturase
MRYCINTFKATTFLWVLFLMRLFGTSSTGILLYLCLHGSYGLAWLVKDLTFPDARFKQKASPGSNFLAFLFLCAYWLVPIPLAAGYGVSEPSLPRMAAIVLLYLGGLALMLVSDHQKTTKLRERPGKSPAMQV